MNADQGLSIRIYTHCRLQSSYTRANLGLATTVMQVDTVSKAQVSSCVLKSVRGCMATASLPPKMSAYYCVHVAINFVT